MVYIRVLSSLYSRQALLTSSWLCVSWNEMLPTTVQPSRGFLGLETSLPISWSLLPWNILTFGLNILTAPGLPRTPSALAASLSEEGFGPQHHVLHLACNTQIITTEQASASNAPPLPSQASGDTGHNTMATSRSGSFCSVKIRGIACR